MPLIGFTEITKRDMEDPTLGVLNNLLRQLIAEMNALHGYSGPVQLQSDLNLNGNKLVNAKNVAGT